MSDNLQAEKRRADGEDEKKSQQHTNLPAYTI